MSFSEGLKYAEEQKEQETWLGIVYVKKKTER